MVELSAKLGFHHENSTLYYPQANGQFESINRHENSTPYYPQANGQVEAINKVLKSMLWRMVGDHKSN